MNGDRLVDPTDGALLMDRLRTGCGECVSSECDIDRSDACDPKDLLRLVDLLGGADMYDPWNGRTLIACPTAP